MRNKNEHPKTYTIREILIFAVLTIIIFIVAMFIVEYFSNVIVNLFAILLPTLVDIVKEIIFGKENSKKKFKSKRYKREAITPSLIRMVASGVEKFFAICKGSFQNPKVWKTTIWLAMVIVLGCVAGSQQSGERFKAAMIAFLYPETVEDALDEINDDKTELKEEDKEWIESHDSELVQTIQGLKISETELQKERKLSVADKNQIYFFTGNHAISNWEDEQAILARVRSFVEGLREEKKKNIFDLTDTNGGATEEIKGEIAQISEDEPTIKSFAQRHENMGIRQNIYKQYPKSSLANLISNDEQLLALTLFYNQGNSMSIEYYYSKGIQYRFEKLKFEGLSRDYIKGELEWIAARYKDIVYTCPDSDVKEYAVKLQKAFEQLAEEY